jgi:hypothetical protein
MDPQEGVVQVGHGIDVGRQATAVGGILEIDPLEGKDGVVAGEAELPGDPVGVESGGVDKVA